jgi:hypothetical protein
MAIAALFCSFPVARWADALDVRVRVVKVCVEGWRWPSIPVGLSSAKRGEGALRAVPWFTNYHVSGKSIFKQWM